MFEQLNPFTLDGVEYVTIAAARASGAQPRVPSPLPGAAPQGPRRDRRRPRHAARRRGLRRMMTLETRTIAVDALRTTTARQIRFTLTDGADGRCANGVIADALGIGGWYPFDSGVPVMEIMRLNDFGCLGWENPSPGTERWTFAEIADWLEMQPVSDPAPDHVPDEWEATVPA